MRFMWDNEFDKYDLTSAGETNNFPKENVQDIRLSQSWRTAILTNAWIKIDTVTGIDASVAVIAGHNLTNAATIKIQGNATDAWGGPTVDETMTWNADSIVKFFTEDNLRFWRFNITDAANPDSYIEAGRLFLGTFYQVEEATDRDLGEDLIDESNVAYSVTGQAYIDVGIERREYRIGLGSVKEATRQSLKSLFSSVGRHVPIFVIIDENFQTQVPIIYCLIDNDFQYRNIAGFVWRDRAFIFREIY